MTADHQQSLQVAVLALLKLVEDESDFANFFIVLEDLTIHCLSNHQELFFSQVLPELQQFLARNAGQHIEFLKHSTNLLKVIMCLSAPNSKAALE